MLLKGVYEFIRFGKITYCKKLVKQGCQFSNQIRKEILG